MYHVLLIYSPEHVVVEQVGFETEGTAIYDTMKYVQNEVRTQSFVLRGRRPLHLSSQINLIRFQDSRSGREPGNTRGCIGQ